MTKQKAKRLALDFVGHCVGVCEAEGFQSLEADDSEPWDAINPGVETQADYTMTVRVGNYLVTLKPTSVSVLPLTTPVEKT